MIAFLLMTVIPFALMIVSTNVILSNQSSILEADYRADEGYINFFSNPIYVFYNMTMTDFEELVNTADTMPERFHDRDYLKQRNAFLESRDSFLVVRKNNRDYFVGNQKQYEKISVLPGFGSYDPGYTDTISIARDVPCLIKSKDFYFPDKSQGQIFLVTDLTHILPTWEQSVKQLVASIILILFLTACFLTIWLYNSIAKPLYILQIATREIGHGNLTDPVQVNSTDEIGELCRDLDDMRIRLREMIEERILYEQETRALISSMAHDLQTPLTSIKGYTEGILDGVANTPAKQEKYLRTILNKASDMSYLVDELSVFSKIEQNSLPYHFIPLSVHDYFEDCIGEFSLDLETKNIHLEYENMCAADTKILADPEQLHRVMQNIIGNAVKYLDKPQGYIIISITDLPIPEPPTPLYRQLNPDGTPKEPDPPPAPPDRFIQIRIQDNGPGIEEKDMPYIFKRFFRADASRNSSRGGSGLGLAIVAKIIEDHGGRVWARSIYGKETSIYLMLKKIENCETLNS